MGTKTAILVYLYKPTAGLWEGVVNETNIDPRELLLA